MMASYLYGCRVPLRRLVWYLVQSGYRFPSGHLAWVPRGTTGPDGLLEYDSVEPGARGDVVEYTLHRRTPAWPTIRPPENGNWTVQAELKARKEQSDDAYCWDECVYELPAGVPVFASAMYMDMVKLRADELGLEVRPWPSQKPTVWTSKKPTVWPSEFAAVIGVRFAQNEAEVHCSILKDIKRAREQYRNHLLALNPEKEQLTQIGNSMPRNFPKDLLPLLLDFIKTPLDHRLLAQLLKSYNNTEEAYIICR
jgi:hypothetical protein